MYLGIEIGGTKLQLGLGRGDGSRIALVRDTVDPAAGGEGIRRQILAAVPALLSDARVDRSALRGIGVGFGGPTDDATQSVIKSHHIAGWDGFPLADWLTQMLGLPTTICNDADVAGLAEALFGAGQGLSPVFYITVGTGIGGGLILDGKIHRGVGRGAAEIGHLSVSDGGYAGSILEEVAAGWGIEARACEPTYTAPNVEAMRRHAKGGRITVQAVVAAAREGDPHATRILTSATDAIGEAICQVITLICPRRIIIGGGVSLIGDDLFFDPIRAYVAKHAFVPFAGLTDIVPAALGEEVVVHGALALARRRFGG